MLVTDTHIPGGVNKLVTDTLTYPVLVLMSYSDRHSHIPGGVDELVTDTLTYPVVLMQLASSAWATVCSSCTSRRRNASLMTSYDT